MTATADITYRFDFTTKVRNPGTFLYNTGPITGIGDATWNRPQYYKVTRIEKGQGVRAGEQPDLPARERGQAQHA